MDAASPQTEPLDDPSYIPPPSAGRAGGDGDYDNDDSLVPSGSKRARSSKTRLPKSAKRKYAEDPDLPASSYAPDLATVLLNDPTDVPASQQTISLSRGLEDAQGTQGGIEALRKEVCLFALFDMLPC
jgi:hypothetical protein